jgi:hypothetical protein
MINGLSWGVRRQLQPERAVIQGFPLKSICPSFALNPYNLDRELNLNNSISLASRVANKPPI